jgi:iron complex transport system substrate-binding protein
VVATDLSATYPPAADALPQIGYQRALNAEPILEFDPTVVIGTDLAGPPEALDALERVGVPVVIVPSAATPTGPAEKISAVAEALGVAAVGDDLAAQVQQEIDAATVAPDEREDAPRVVALYLRGDNVRLVLGEGSGIDWLIEAAGGVDVADELGIVDNAPITAEALVAAAPDVIVVPASGLDSVGGVDGLLEVPGIAETPAGAGQAVLAYDAQLMLGNGPRTGAFLTQLVADLSAATTAE